MNKENFDNLLTSVSAEQHVGVSILPAWRGFPSKDKIAVGPESPMRHDRPGTMGFSDSPEKENYDPLIMQFTPTKAKQRKRYAALREITEKSKPPVQETAEDSQDNENEMDLLFSSFPTSPFRSRNIREL